MSFFISYIHILRLELLNLLDSRLFTKTFKATFWSKLLILRGSDDDMGLSVLTFNPDSCPTQWKEKSKKIFIFLWRKRERERERERRTENSLAPPPVWFPSKRELLSVVRPFYETGMGGGSLFTQNHPSQSAYERCVLGNGAFWLIKKDVWKIACDFQVCCHHVNLCPSLLPGEWSCIAGLTSWKQIASGGTYR